MLTSCVDLYLTSDLWSSLGFLTSLIGAMKTLCVIHSHSGYRGVWPQMGKPHLSFLMTIGPHFTVTMGLDISGIGFKESSQMRNTKRLILKDVSILCFCLLLSYASCYNTHTHTRTLVSSCMVGLNAGIKNQAFWGCGFQNIHKTLEPWTDLLALLMIRLWGAGKADWHVVRFIYWMMMSNPIIRLSV